MDDPFAAFSSPSRKPLRRTYSRRGQCLSDALIPTGLATPPASSSPPASPSALAFSEDFVFPSVSAKRVLVDRSNVQSPMPKQSKSTRNSTKKRRLADTIQPSSKKPLVQMQLNLLPARVTCQTCGMAYTRTSAADNQLHTTFHKAALHGVSLPSALSNLSAIAHGKASSCLQGAVMHAVATRTAKTGERAFVKRVCEMVDVELGSTLPCLDKTPFTAFLCCHAGRCISFLLVERITEAMPMTSAHELDLSRKTDAVLGVNRMWTVKSFRGKGLMQALLDYAREKLVYGCVIGVKEVAFTQLSGSGEAFAKTYTGMHEPLIYRD